MIIYFTKLKPENQPTAAQCYYYNNYLCCTCVIIIAIAAAVTVVTTATTIVGVAECYHHTCQKAIYHMATLCNVCVSVFITARCFDYCDWGCVQTQPKFPHISANNVIIYNHSFVCFSVTRWWWRRRCYCRQLICGAVVYSVKEERIINVQAYT